MQKDLMAGLPCSALSLALVLTPLPVNSSPASSSPYDWKMTCAEWNENRIEVLTDNDLNPDAREYLIDYLLTKVDGECDAYTIL